MVAKIILSEQQKSEIINLYKEKTSVEYIKRIIGLDRRLILPILKENGLLRQHLSLKVADIPEAIKLYNSGLHAREIAEKFSVSAFSVLNKLKLNNVKTRNNKDIVSEELLGEIISLYRDEGLSSITIADRIKISEATICRLLRKHGIEKNRYTKIPKENEEKIIKLYLKDGLSASAISRKFKVHNQVISKILRRHNIEIKPSSAYPKNRKVTLEDEKDIIRLYSEGRSSYQIAEEYHLVPGSILLILKRNGVVINHNKKASGVTKKTKKFILKNEELKHFFDKYDIQESLVLSQTQEAGIKESFIEEYLIYTKRISQSNKFIKNYSSVFFTTLINPKNIENFYQKIEGRLRGHHEEPKKKLTEIEKTKLFLQNNPELFKKLFAKYKQDVSVKILLKYLKIEELINSDFIIKALLPEVLKLDNYSDWFNAKIPGKLPE